LSTAIIAVFGYLRIYGYLTTGQLWLSIGMHTGWNFFQATVFGFAASGHAEEWLLFTHESKAAKWLYDSGGSDCIADYAGMVAFGSSSLVRGHGYWWPIAVVDRAFIVSATSLLHLLRHLVSAFAAGFFFLAEHSLTQ
jgi:hypothetical protein